MSEKNIDYKLFFTILSIVIFGMIMISSVSVYSSFKVTNKLVLEGKIAKAYNYFYLYRSIISIIIGLFVMGIITKINYKVFEKYSKHIFFLVLGLLVFVLVKGISLKGAVGWINIPGIPFTIQPTEFFKISIIIFLAAFFKKYNKDLSDFKKGLIPFLGIIGVGTILIGLQPDFGTLLVILPVSTMLFYFAGGNIKHLISLILIGLLLIFSVYSYGKYDKTSTETIKKTKTKFSYITDRIDNFLADKKNAIKNSTINYQTKQGLIAVGSGGFKGKGFGKSIQKFGYLPEVQGDFIYSVIVEELGFIGGSFLIFVYLYIGYRGFYISSNVSEPFGKYLSFGITSRILFQSFINIGVVLNVVPLTGITLPFVSYGGSSLLSLMIGLGILLSISRELEKKSAFSRLDRKKLLF